MARSKWIPVAVALAGVGGVVFSMSEARASTTSSPTYSLSSNSGVGIGQIGGQGNFDLSSQSSDTGAPVSASVSNQTFTGKDSTGATRTMTFSGVNQASASFSGLHIYSSATVANLYYNASNPKADDGSGTLNPNGSPDYLYSLGFASFTDTLQFGGALQSGYQARYVFHVDGTMTDDFPTTAADMAFQISGNDPESFFVLVPGYTSTTWATKTYAINGMTPQTVSVQFSTQVSVNAFDHADGDNYSGYADFGSTLTLDHIEIVDSAGNPVSGVTVSSDSGTSYVVAVPEPGALGTLAGCGLVLLWRGRRGV